MIRCLHQKVTMKLYLYFLWKREVPRYTSDVTQNQFRSCSCSCSGVFLCLVDLLRFSFVLMVFLVANRVATEHESYNFERYKRKNIRIHPLSSFSKIDVTPIPIPTPIPVPTPIPTPTPTPTPTLS